MTERLDGTWMNWSEPENVGFGVNSNFAEIYYAQSSALGYAYFVSYKHSFGSGDIFRIRIEPKVMEDTTEVVQDTIQEIVIDTTQEIVIDTSQLVVIDSVQITELEPPQETELTVEDYASNNLVFLVDLSGSMRSSSKLPVLKSALKRLIEELRDIDQIAVISFADSAQIHFSVQGVVHKDSLFTLIDSMRADGRSRANRGLEVSYAYTARNFLRDGNNEVILVTDGKFRLSASDHQRIEDNQDITLSTVGLGTDKDALKTLKKLARKSRGSFIHIKDDESGTEALLEEVKKRSRR